MICLARCLKIDRSSKCGPGTSNVNLSWELVRNANAQTHPRHCVPETLGVWNTAVCVLTNLPEDSDATC